MAKAKDRLSDAKPYVTRALQDEEVREGKKEHSSRNATLLLTGIVLGILFNPVTGPQTRDWLSDKLLGGEEDTSPGSSGNNSAA